MEKRCNKHLVNDVERRSPLFKNDSSDFCSVKTNKKDGFTLRHRGNLKRGSPRIVINNNYLSPASIAHEYGHALNYAANGGYESAINRGNERKKNTHKSRLLVLDEESNATRNGMNILKKEGATPSQMRRARQELKKAYKTYYEAAKYNDSKYQSENGKHLIDYLKSKTRGEIDDAYKAGLEKIENASKTNCEKRLDTVANRGILDKVKRNAKCAKIKLSRRYPSSNIEQVLKKIKL